MPILLRRLKEQTEIGEIIVADGASSDATIQIARENGALVVEGAVGRGAQQNAGAAVATGEILWFLHADCLPSRHAASQIVQAAENGAIGGNFRVRFAGNGVAPRVFEIIARIQRNFGIYYGDSGIWLERTVWNELGGFQNWPLFEDYDLARRLEKRGKTAICPGILRVSARRFQKRAWRVLGLWIALQIGFWWGMKPEELAHRYRK